MEFYKPSKIEPKWQKIWSKKEIYKAQDFSSKPKFIMLTEFPYPSGDGLHMGHIREYTLGDIYARYIRMNGYNVLFPMGYDAFGLPAENYAIKQHISPQQSTSKNISNFKKQFEKLGFSFDQSREINTSDPKYYKWTQWLFLQFFKKGLAYQEDTLINWCPFCKTGLSNEEVINGRHERCDTLVTKKKLKQWVLKITDYAEKLLTGLKTVDYPKNIADQQINWIGKSEGALIDFEIKNSNQKLTIFTTAHDTIFGVTFMVLAPEHPLIAKITKDEQIASVRSYQKMAESKSDLDRQDDNNPKTGVFTGAYAINPLNGSHIPIWISDYVLMNYGTGAIMSVPGNDLRDYQFAKKYELPIIYTSKENEFVSYQDQIKKNPTKYIMAHSEEFSGLTFKEGRKRILKLIEDKKIGKKQIQYRLRDWIFSRQRYWGEPIPIIHCPDHGAVPVPENELPVLLPKIDDYLPSDDGLSPLSKVEQFVNTTCPICNKPSKRETNTMPNWAGSSWYYLRYFDPNNDQQFASKDKLKYWGKVDFYLGGMEHTTLHLLYSRFWHNFLYDIGLVPFQEPYAKRRGQGIILATDGTKMSKSKGNVVNPIDIIDQGYGADGLHLAIAFLAPYDQTTPWSPESVVGAYRFLDRVYRLFQKTKLDFSLKELDFDLEYQINYVIKTVTEDIEGLNFNTALSSLMEYTNKLYKLSTQPLNKDQWQRALETLIQLLAPFSPFLSEELWSGLSRKGSIHLSAWPKYRAEYLIKSSNLIVIQVNGKLRSKIEVSSNISDQQLKEIVRNDPRIKSIIGNSKISRFIIVKNRLVNIVI